MTIRISCRVKDLRKEKELTQEDLAQKLGISRQALISVEKGQSLPSLSLALQISDIFERTIEEIFCDFSNFNRKISEGVGGDQKQNNLKRKENKMSRWLTPWRPLGLGRFFDEDLLDEDFLPDVKLSAIGMRAPAVDVYEKGSNVIVEVQLPGIKVEDVKVEVADDHVALSGEKKEEKEEKDKNFYRRETSYGSFSRVVPLPVKVNADKAEASSEDGVLKIVLPKVEVKKRKEVRIKIAKKK